MQRSEILKLIQDVEQALRDHRMRDASRLLKAVSPKDVPFSYRADLAQLARRGNLHSEGLKFLQDRVFGIPSPDPKDVLEYASCLRKIGMARQCLNLLSRLPNSHDKLLYEAFCHIHHWDYPLARPLLEQLIGKNDLGLREQLVVRLNLLSCLIFQGELTEARKLVTDLLARCGFEFKQFYLNTLELKGQMELQAQELKAARSTLDVAESLAAEEEGTTTLFIRKWRLVAQLMESPQNVSDQAIEEFESSARRLGHWETLRDFHGYLARLAGQGPGLSHVYFGTPFMSYRDSVARQNPGIDFGASYAWGRGGQEFDPLSLTSSKIPYGLISHRLLLALLSDFYRPWSVARIFDHLFADEIFDPVSSPKRIYAQVSKLQGLLVAGQIPLILKATTHGFRLRPTDTGRIRVHRRMNFVEGADIYHFVLTELLGLQRIDAATVKEVTGLSQHKIYRLLRELESKGFLLRRTARDFILRQSA